MNHRSDQQLLRDYARGGDETVGELAETDRQAVLLRYFRKQTAREMALQFGTSEEAAQKRVARPFSP